MNLEAVTIFRTWVDVAEALKSDAERGRFYHAICRYALEGEEPQLDGALKAYFTLIRPYLDRSNRLRRAQEGSVRKRRQNSLQCDLHTDLHTDLQCDLHTDLQCDLHTDLHAPSDNKKENEKKNVSKETSKEKFSFADQLPDHLQTPVFLEKWKEWESYRRTKRKPISQAAFRQMLVLLKGMTESEAVEAIDTSIANDWQGLFPPRGTMQGKISQGERKDHSGI